MMPKVKIVTKSKYPIKYFAMLHNAAALQGDTELEGGFGEEAIGYYLNLLNLHQQDIPDSFVLPFEKEVAAEMQRLYEMCILMDELAEKKQLLIAVGLNTVIESIKEQCDTNGYCYLPLGYTAFDAGHFLGIKIRKTNSEYLFSSINHGAGIRYHLQTSVSGIKHKYSYQSNEFSIDINSEEGLEFIKNLLEVNYAFNRAAMKKSHINPYGSLDIYGLMKLYGNENKLDLLDAQENRSVIPQRSGTCTMTNTHAIGRDVLIRHQADFKTRKRYHFIIKLRSLMDGFDRYRAGECSLEIFAWALNEFSVRLNKYYSNILNDEEFAYCAKLQNKMKAHIDKDKAAILVKNTRIQQWLENENDIDHSQPNLELHEANSQPTFEEVKLEEDFFFSDVPATFIKSYLSLALTNWLSAKSLDGIYLLLTNLTSCTGENKDPYWDEVKTDDIAYIIDKFAQVANYMEYITNENIPDEQKAKACVVALIMYDIVAQLLPRLEEYKLGTEYTLGLDDIYSQQYYFSNPNDYFRVKNIAHNFAKRAQDKKTIFSNVLNNEKKNLDKTIYYILYVAHDQEFRSELLEKVKAKHPEKKDDTITDGDLFNCWIKQSNSKIQTLSSLAHHAGLSTKKYHHYTDIWGNGKHYDSRFHFTNTSYLAQILRKSARLTETKKMYIKNSNKLKYKLANNEIEPDKIEQVKSFLSYAEAQIMEDQLQLYCLPARDPSNQNDHNDYSENSIYIPYDKMREMDNATKNRRTRFYRPFEVQLSGSIHPWNENYSWDIKPDNLQSYIELNEAFRLLECSPHYQVIKTLYWIKNNSAYLNNKIVRERTLQLVFEYGKFDLAFANNPEETLLSIQSLFSMAGSILKEKVNNMDVCLWYLNLVQKLRDYVLVTAAEYDFSLKDYEYLNIRDMLLNQIQKSHPISHKVQLASLLLSDLEMTGITSIEETCQLLVARLLLSLGADPIPQQHIWIKHKQKILDRLNGNDADIFTHTIIQALNKYQIIETSQLIWDQEKQQLINAANNIYIDLSLGAFFDPKTSFIKKDQTDLAFLHNEALLKGLNLQNNGKFRLYSLEQYLESSDGRWQFEYQLDTSTNLIKITDVTLKTVIDGHPIDFAIVNKFWKEDEKSKFDAYFHIWQSPYPNNIRLAHSILSEKTYLLLENSAFNILLHREDNGNFSTTDSVILSLTKPSTAMELSWSQRLKKIVDLELVHCLAKYNAEKKTLQIQSIEMLGLGIRFDLDNKSHLVCCDYPSYYLSKKISLPELHGFPSVLVLENDKDELKIIIPAYALNKERENNTFHFDNIVNINEFCFDDQRYFTYTLNQNGELEGDSLASKMYLALLLRSLGDFKTAVFFLNQCRTHEIIDPRVMYLIYQILNRPLLSPQGAAFDLKLATYLYEHAKKWYKEKASDAKIPDISLEMQMMFNKHVKKITELYQSSYSHFKSEISIHPSYLRLTAHEKSVLELDEIVATHAKPIEQDKNFTLVSQYPTELVNQFFSPDLLPSNEDMLDYEGSDNHAIRIDYHGKKSFDALTYLFSQFKDLLNDAISDDPNRHMHLKRRLFFIFQHQAPKSVVYQPDEKRLTTFYGLISLLLFVNANYNSFKIFNIEDIGSSSLYELITNVIRTLKDNKEISKAQIVPLIEFQVSPYQIKVEKPLDFDIERETLHYDIAPITSEFIRPFKSFLPKYILRKDIPVASAPFPLAEEEFATLLEQNLFHRYKQGHEINLTRTQPEYQHNDKYNLADLVTELNNHKKEDKKALKIVTERLLKMANKTPLDDENATDEQKAQAYYLMQQYASEQKHPLELGDIFVALLQKNPNLLALQNPFLTQADIKSIFTTLSELAFTKSRIDQSNRILNIITDKKELKAFEVQEYSTLLDHTRTYTIHDYPEFLVYEYATGVMLRPDQVETLIKLIEYISRKKSDDEIRHALLQFAAGGGKTAVLIPILAQRFANMGLLPVIINTSELYEIGLDQLPKSLKSSFKQQLEVIECELDYKWTTKELIKLHNDLNLWLNNKEHLRCVLVKSVTWHSLNIARKSAYMEGDVKRASAAEEVLKFFKDKTIKLEDECHIVSDSMLQSIKTEGKQVPIPKHQLQLLQRFYDFLMGKDKAPNSIPKLAGIVNNKKTPILPRQLVLLQTQLADAIAEDDLMGGCDKTAVIEYLTKKDKKRPAWLVNLHNGASDQKDLADRIVLARSFIKVHLPYILSLQQHKDFGMSKHTGDLTAAPKHEGNDVSSHFGDYALLASLTIQMYKVNGLTPQQIITLLERVITDSRKEREWNFNYSALTAAEAWLSHIIPDLNSYEDLTNEAINNIAFDPNYAKHPLFVKAFLNDYALPQIRVPLKRLTSTAAELQAGFTYSIMVSATPGLPEMYPAFIGKENDNIFMDESFEAHVIDTLMHEKNKKHVMLDMNVTAPSAFFNQFSTEDLKTITTLIDRGSLLTDFKAEEIIKTYFAIEESKRATASAAFFSAGSSNRQKMYLKSQSPEVSEVEIDGSALITALRKQNIDPEEFMLFLFLDLSKTTGTDILRPYQDKAALTVGKGQTVTETIQAAMRQRRLLKKDAQTITWVLFKSLYAQIAKDNPLQFDSRRIIPWLIKNEAEKIDIKLKSRAYQGIDQALSEVMWAKIADDALLYEKYKDFLESTQSISSYDIYEAESTQEKPDVVLVNYYNRILDAADMTFDSLPNFARERIEKIIRETSLLIEMLDDPSKVQIGVEVQQTMQQEMQEETKTQTQQRVKTRLDEFSEFSLALETYNQENDVISTIFNKHPDYKPLVLPHCEDMNLPELLISTDQFSVTTHALKDKLMLTELKPINQLLIKIMPNNKFEYVACTAAGLEFYTKQLKEMYSSVPYPAYAIVSSDGDILSRSHNLTIAELQTIIKTDSCQTMLTYTNFLNGDIFRPDLLAKLLQEYHIATYEQYLKLIDAIQTIHVSQCPILLLNNPQLNAFCGWFDKPVPIKSVDVKLSEKKDISLASYAPYPKLPHRITSLEKDEDYQPMTALDNEAVGKPFAPFPILSKHAHSQPSQTP